MTAFATSDDVEAALGRTLTDGELERVDGLLELASGQVFAETGYYFAPGTYTIGRPARVSKLKIPANVNAVTSVKEIDQCDGTETLLTAGTDYVRRGSVLYGLRAAWAEILFVVTAAVPTEIVALVAGMVATTLDTPGANVASDTAGPFTRSFISTSGRVYLSVSDKAALRKYKQTKPAINLVGREFVL